MEIQRTRTDAHAPTLRSVLTLQIELPNFRNPTRRAYVGGYVSASTLIPRADATWTPKWAFVRDWATGAAETWDLSCQRHRGAHSIIRPATDLGTDVMGHLEETGGRFTVAQNQASSPSPSL